MKKILLFGFISLILYFSTAIASAHPGNVSYDGCHYCWTNCSSWGFTYGTRHNNSNYNNTCSCDPNLGPRDPIYCPSTPQISCPNNDEYKNNITYEPNSDGSTYTVNMAWADLGDSGYSVSIDQNQGSDPGPLIDTQISQYSFKNILPGNYYIHMKVGINNQWCNSVYWAITVPEWVSPSPSPTESPTPGPTESTMVDSVMQNVSNNFWGYVIFGIVIAYITAIIINSSRKKSNENT